MFPMLATQQCILSWIFDVSHLNELQVAQTVRWRPLNDATQVSSRRGVAKYVHEQWECHLPLVVQKIWVLQSQELHLSM
jgi:hypothetical protein